MHDLSVLSFESQVRWGIAAIVANLIVVLFSQNVFPDTSSFLKHTSGLGAAFIRRSIRWARRAKRMGIVLALFGVAQIAAMITGPFVDWMTSPEVQWFCLIVDTCALLPLYYAVTSLLDFWTLNRSIVAFTPKRRVPRPPQGIVVLSTVPPTEKIPIIVH